jgi:hypothetical protein
LNISCLSLSLFFSLLIAKFCGWGLTAALGGHVG